MEDFSEITQAQQNYDENQIQVLEGLEAVQKASGNVYWINRTAADCIILVYEIVDNCDR